MFIRQKYLAMMVILIALLVFPALCLASVAIQEDGVYKGEATTINFTGGVDVTGNYGTKSVAIAIGTTLTSIGVTSGSVSQMTTGSTVIPTSYRAVRMTCSTKTNTLANGVEGQVLHLRAYDATGTLTISPATSYGWADATMTTNGDELTLWYANDTLGWMVLSTRGNTSVGVVNE